MAMRFTLPSIIRTPARRSAAGRGLPLALAWLALVPWYFAPAGRAAEEAGTKPRAAYERTPYALPSESKFEVSGIAVLPDGRAALTLRKGEVWILENPLDDPTRARYRKFASGLHEPLGLTWHQGALYTTQRSEVTRMEDRDGDGVADTYVTVAAGWGLSGNYHEYAYGPVFDPAGNLWVTLNVTIGSPAKLAGHRGGTPLWRGWAMRQAPGGELLPVAAGFRSPFGLGLNAEGDVFATDQQGNWWGTCPLIHVQPGRFYGHADSIPDTRRPESPVKDPGVLPSGLTVVEAAARIPGFALPAVWFPYVKMGQSTTGIICNQTAGAFGPFERQLFIGDFTLAQVNRVFLEKVDGEYQGACFPFLDQMQSAVLQMAFLKDGSMIVGESNRGWNSLGSRSFGLERIRWTGHVPFELQTMEATSDGFRLTFTEPVAAPSSLTPSQFKLSSYTYLYQQAYGSPETATQDVAVDRLKVSADGRVVTLTCSGLRAGFVHQLVLGPLQSASGQSLRYDRAYYTLNRIPAAGR
jgi:glucose/arabinose dehydrogenase